MCLFSMLQRTPEGYSEFLGPGVALKGVMDAGASWRPYEKDPFNDSFVGNFIDELWLD